MASIGIRTLADGTARWRVQDRVDGRVMQATFIDQNSAEKFKGLVERVGWVAAKAVLAARERKSATPTLRDLSLIHI